MNRNSAESIHQLMKEQGFSCKKRFGQNFLLTQDVKKDLVQLLKVEEGELIWEIGPGLGALTEYLLQTKGKIILFEIDHGFAAYLVDAFQSDQMELVEGDFLQTFPSVEAKSGFPEKIIGNLPYSTASPMIVKILKTSLRPKRMVFTLQREVAERCCADRGSKNYSVLSIFCQTFYRCRVVRKLAPGNFYPRPEVESAVLLMDNPKDPSLPSTGAFFQLIHHSFLSRRKTLVNNLKGAKIAGGATREELEDILGILGISSNVRGESLSPDQFLAIWNLIRERMPASGYED